MTTNPVASPQPTQNDNSLGATVLVWGGVQLAALALAAARVPLWAKPAPPIDSLALQFLLTVQLFTCAMLFPWLLRGWERAVPVALVGCVMLQFAGMLSGAVPDVPRLAVSVSIWITGLWMWSGPLRRAGLQHVGICVSLAFVTLSFVLSSPATHIVVGQCGLIISGLIARIGLAGSSEKRVAAATPSP